MDDEEANLRLLTQGGLIVSDYDIEYVSNVGD